MINKTRRHGDPRARTNWSGECQGATRKKYKFSDSLGLSARSLNGQRDDKNSEIERYIFSVKINQNEREAFWKRIGKNRTTLSMN